MSNCFYCNQGEHSAVECQEKELAEDVEGIHDILQSARSLPNSALFDLPTMQKNALWGHSVFSQYLIFTGHAEMLKKEYGRGVKCEDADAKDFYERGVDFLLHDSVSEAVSCLKRSIKLAPDFCAPHVAFAYCLIEKADYGAAEASILEALRLSPTNRISSYLQVMLARFCQCSGKTEEAIEFANKAVNADSSFFLPFYQLAILHSSLGDVEKVVQDLTKLEPKNSALFAGFFIEAEVLSIRSKLVESMEAELRKREVKIKEIILNAEKLLGEALAEEGNLFAPHNFKIAELKIKEAKKSSYESFQGATDAMRDAEDAILYLDTVKGLTKTRKILTEKAVESFFKSTKKAGLTSGVLVSGWAFVLGGFLGIIRYSFYSEPPLYILFWGLGVAVLAFFILQFNCIVLLLKYKKSFMKKYVESFKSQKMDDLFQKEVSSYGSRKDKREEIRNSLF